MNPVNIGAYITHKYKENQSKNWHNKIIISKLIILIHNKFP